MSEPGLACPSRLLTRIQRLGPVRVRANPPDSLLPCSVTDMCPGSSRRISAGPSSQMITAPVPRLEPSCTPSNSPSASEWSSTGTASLRTAGSSEGPFGTAHDRSTPPARIRRSKCSVVASCSWTTNRDGITLATLPADLGRGARGPGAGRSTRNMGSRQSRRLPILEPGHAGGGTIVRLTSGDDQAAASGDADELTAELTASYWQAYDQRMASTGFRAIARQFPSIVGQAMRLAGAANRRDLVATIGLNLASGVFAGYALFATTGVLEALFAAGPTPHRVRAALPSLALVAASVAARSGLQVAAGWAQSRLQPQVDRVVELRLFSLTTEVELAAFDDADFHDAMRRARDRGLRSE